MIPCAIIGDSIAVGVGAHRPDCQTSARVGVTSHGYLASLVGNPSGRLVVVSLGANDTPVIATLANLTTLRALIAAHRVAWLLPARPAAAREAIATVARSWGDALIDTAPFAGSDGLHPTAHGYRAIAQQLTETSK